MEIKNTICAIFGVIGGIFTTALGGWDLSVKFIVGLIIIDYISGLIVAGVFKASKKTQNGALESRAGAKGLVKKCMILIFIIIAHYLDSLTGSNYIRDAVCIGFIINELISITENAGLMGIKLPSVLEKAIEVLKQKYESEDK